MDCQKQQQQQQQQQKTWFYLNAAVHQLQAIFQCSQYPNLASENNWSPSQTG